MLFIMSVSLLRTHMVQIRYADTPGPTVMVEKGKRFPIYKQLQFGSKNGSIWYPCWQTRVDYQPSDHCVTAIRPNSLLQEGDNGSRLEGDQGGGPGQGGLGCPPTPKQEVGI